MPGVLYHACSYTANPEVPQMLCTKPLNSYKENKKSQINRYNYKADTEPVLKNEMTLQKFKELYFYYYSSSIQRKYNLDIL